MVNWVARASVKGRRDAAHPRAEPEVASGRRLPKLVATVLGLLVLGWFGIWPFISPIDLPFQRVEATITPRVTVEGKTIRVEGATSLPDGAVIGYYYWHSDEAVNDRNDSHPGTATVRHGRFGFTTDLSDWPEGDVTLLAEFAVGGDWEQPPEVVARFGSQGEHLSGPQVDIDSPGDPKRLLVPVMFELGSSQPAP
mgnify:CR=1 FL=1